MKQRLIQAVMSGGSGTRLWPLSTERRPKQFHALGSAKTLIQDSLARIKSFGDLERADPIVICNLRHSELVAEQIETIGRGAGAVILEPFGRNTAAVAAISALIAHGQDPDALVLLTPADHVIVDADAFSATVVRTFEVARTHIVTFGVTPTEPETGYGYIEAGDVIDGDVRRVARFAEKPDMKTAQAYVDGGRHLWNAGIFLFSPAVMIAEMERHAPQVMAASREALRKGRAQGNVIELDPEAFAACPSISIDYAVMEKTAHAAVAPIGSDWADVGSWSELWRLGPRDAQENFARGDTLLLDTKDSLVWADSKPVAVVGLSGLIVVQTDEGVIVLPKSRAQDVKIIAETLKKRTQGLQR